MTLELEKVEKSEKKDKIEHRPIGQEKKAKRLDIASPFLRGLAFFFDMVLVFGYFFYFLNPEILQTQKLSGTDIFFILNIYIVLVAIPESIFRMGIGKFLCKLKIESEGDEDVGFSRCFVRSFYRLTPILIIPLGKLFSRKKFFYDDLLNAYVVKDKS